MVRAAKSLLRITTFIDKLKKKLKTSPGRLVFFLPIFLLVYNVFMTLPTHAVLGLIIGKITGSYGLAIAASTLIDADHLISYVKSGVIKNPKLFWKTIMDQKDPYGDQRGILHNIFIWAFVSLIIFLFSHSGGIVISIGWLGHIFLEAIDNSDYWPLYPNKKINLKGPINYGSWQEGIVFAVLLITFFII